MYLLENPEKAKIYDPDPPSPLRRPPRSAPSRLPWPGGAPRLVGASFLLPVLVGAVRAVRPHRFWPVRPRPCFLVSR